MSKVPERLLFIDPQWKKVLSSEIFYKEYLMYYITSSANKTTNLSGKIPTKFVHTFYQRLTFNGKL